MTPSRSTLPGAQLAYHAVSGGFILGEVVHRVTGKDIRTVLAEEFLDPLGFRWTNYGVDPADVDAVALNYITGPRTAAAALDAAQPCARLRPRRSRREHQRPPLPDRHRPRREHDHDRQRALALLRGDALRRRDRRRPGDRGRHDPPRPRRALTPRGRPLARLPDPLLLRADARLPRPQPLRPRHPARLRASRLHEHARLGRSRAGDLGRGPQQRQADPLPGGAPLPRHDAADHERDAEGPEDERHL